jgi:uncharacterized protein YdcH (DUF465 family)
MGVKPTFLLVLSLASVTFCASAQTEPNDAAARLKFETSTLTPSWTVGGQVGDESVTYTDPGSIRPKYMAQIILPRERMLHDRTVLAKITASPLAQRFSQAQEDFLAQGFSVWVDASAANVPNHYSVNLYAASEEDAKIMARALVDGFAKDAQETRAHYQDALAKEKQSLKENQAALVEKQKQFEEGQRQYETAKESTYPLIGDDEASQLAKELVLQMDRQAKTLDIDLAGVQGKLQVINEYLLRPDLDNDVIERLEVQKIEQMIELTGLEARRQAIERIRAEQQHFRTLVRQHSELHNSVKTLEQDVSQNERGIRELTDLLEHPKPFMLPTQVYQGKVILYHIRAQGSRD